MSTERENPVVADGVEDDVSARSITDRRKAGWDIRNAPRTYVSLIFLQLASAALSFGAVWLITHYLGSEGYGGVVAVIAASQVAQIVVNWTAVAVVRFGVDEFVSSAVITKVFWTRSAVLLCNLILVLAAYPLWFSPLAKWLQLSPSSLWLVTSHMVATVLWMHVQVGLQAVKMLKTQGLLQMIERAAIFVGILGLVLSKSLYFGTATMCYIGAPLLMFLIGLIRVSPYVGRPAFNTELLPSIVRYSLPLLPFALVGYLSGSYVDAAFIATFLSKSDLGIYSIATQINGIALQVPTLANTVLLPLLVTLQSESGGRSFNYFRHVLPGAVLGWGLGCTLLAAAAGPAIPLVFGPQYWAAIAPLWVLLSATVVALPVAIGYSALANSTSATYIPLVATVVSASINIGANFALIPKYGMVGCAVATLISYSASALMFALLLRSAAEMPISWTFFAAVPNLVATYITVRYGVPFIGVITAVVGTLAIGLIRQASITEMYRFFSAMRITSNA